MKIAPASSAMLSSPNQRHNNYIRSPNNIFDFQSKKKKKNICLIVFFVF